MKTINSRYIDSSPKKLSSNNAIYSYLTSVSIYSTKLNEFYNPHYCNKVFAITIIVNFEVLNFYSSKKRQMCNNILFVVYTLY